MKYTQTINLSAVVIIILLIAGCKANKPSVQATLTGVLPDVKNEMISLVPVADYFPGLIAYKKFPSVKTDSNGQFIFQLDSIEPAFYQVIHNTYPQLKADIYLEPGDSIYIKQSSWNDPPLFQLAGRGSDKIKHIERDIEIFPRDKVFYEKIRSNAFANELNFKAYIDSLYLLRINALKENTSLPIIIKNHYLKSYAAERAEFLLDHLERRNYYMKNGFEYYYPDSRYTQFLDSIDFDNQFAQTTAAKQLAKTYLDYLARIEFKSKSEEEWWNENITYKLNLISKRQASLWTDLLALSTIDEYSIGLASDGFFKNMEEFQIVTNNLFTDKNNKLLYDTNARDFLNLAPGQIAPDFELPDSSGKLVRLSDFKGTIVYLDFWGTWCFPCITELPDALKLQVKFKNKPVTFLYVALEYDNDDILRWKEFIAGKSGRFSKFLNHQSFPGVHLVAEKQFRNESIKSYKLNFAPTHVLIDKEGKIVKPRAKGPNGISDEIDALLTKN